MTNPIKDHMDNMLENFDAMPYQRELNESIVCIGFKDSMPVFSSRTPMSRSAFVGLKDATFAERMHTSTKSLVEAHTEMAKMRPLWGTRSKAYPNIDARGRVPNFKPGLSILTRTLRQLNGCHEDVPLTAKVRMYADS